MKSIIQFATQVWKDPVWSKVISVGILAVIATTWARFSYTWSQIGTFFVWAFCFKVPIGLPVVLFVIYLLSTMLIKWAKPKNRSLWDEKIGHFTFKQLHKIFSEQKLPIQTSVMEVQNIPPPQDNLLQLFNRYSLHLVEGVPVNEDIGDGYYLRAKFASKLMSYGLIKTEQYIDEHGYKNARYILSDDGFKFYAQLEKLRT